MKKLSKANNSEIKPCSTLYAASQIFATNKYGNSLNYVMRNVGVNDLDEKNHTQVFGEAEILFDEIRSKHPGIKLIVSEITPRNDIRDSEVKAFNNLLHNYAVNHADITVAIHNNLRDPSWSMYRDAKHIKEEKIGKFAANLIKALKTAYGITNKSELFRNTVQNCEYRNQEMNFRQPRKLMDCLLYTSDAADE